jgi:hypothetical protein
MLSSVSRLRSRRFHDLPLLAQGGSTHLIHPVSLSRGHADDIQDVSGNGNSPASDTVNHPSGNAIQRSRPLFATQRSSPRASQLGRKDLQNGRKRFQGAKRRFWPLGKRLQAALKPLARCRRFMLNAGVAHEGIYNNGHVTPSLYLEAAYDDNPVNAKRAAQN